MTIHLGCTLLYTSCNQPGQRSVNGSYTAPIWSCSRWGLPSPVLLPAPRCALTAPFHPYSGPNPSGLLSVALSLGSPPPDVIRHRIHMEPGLSSGRYRPKGPHPPAAIQPTDARFDVSCKCSPVKSAARAARYQHHFAPKTPREIFRPDRFCALVPHRCDPAPGQPGLCGGQ